MIAVDELDWQEHESTTGRHRRLQQLTARPVDDSAVTQIEVRSEGESVSVQSFPPGRIIVGRAPDNEIYVQSKFVSRHHAQLISDDDGCIIEDLNSTNGVFIGEKQIKKYRLRNGDVISLGVHELIYTDLRETAAADGESDDDGDELDSSEEEASAVGE